MIPRASRTPVFRLEHHSTSTQILCWNPLSTSLSSDLSHQFLFFPSIRVALFTNTFEGRFINQLHVWSNFVVVLLNDGRINLLMEILQTVVFNTSTIEVVLYIHMKICRKVSKYWILILRTMSSNIKSYKFLM